MLWDELCSFHLHYEVSLKSSTRLLVFSRAEMIFMLEARGIVTLTYQLKITMWLLLVLYCNTDIYDVNNVARVPVYEKKNLRTACVLMSQ